MPMVAERTHKATFARLSTAAFQWQADGWPVYPRLLFYKDGKLAKAAFRLCDACRSLGLGGAECGCSCLLCHAQHKATLDYDRVLAMLVEAVQRCGEGASVGLGVVVPETGLVLDVDRHPGGDDGLDALASLISLAEDGKGETVHTDPETRMVSTVSGGFHFYYSMPAGSVLPKSGRLKVKGSTALEVKRPGEYLVVPPSCDPRSGARYWEHFDDLGLPMAAIQPAPPRLLALLRLVAQGERRQEEDARAAVTFRQPYDSRSGEHRSARFADPLAAVLQRLDELGKRRRREGAGWLAQCPAHDDKHPSLSITPKDNGVRLKCFTGCDTSSICHALGLRVADLFGGRP